MSAIQLLFSTITMFPLFHFPHLLYTFVFFHRHISLISLIIGLFLNECLNICLKNLIRIERPLLNGLKQNDGFGMPSSHAAYMAFYLSFHVWEHLNMDRNGKGKKKLDWLKVIGLLIITLTTVLVCYSRVYLHKHDVPQVLAGFLCGAIFYWSWQRYIGERLVHRIMSYSPVELNMMKTQVVK